MTNNQKTTAQNHDKIVTVIRGYQHPFNPKETLILHFNIPESQVRTYRYPDKQEAYEILMSKR